MTNQSPVPGNLWSIVLAGGNVSRISTFVQRWLGYPKPKPYCAFVGERSLLQHTLDRAAILCQLERIVTVVARDSRREAWPQFDGRGGGTMLTEPNHVGTVAEMYLPLTYVRAKDPYATVMVFPSDHFVYPEHLFLGSVQRAAWAAEWLPDRLVLLGVMPERLELDYGWVVPGKQLAGSSTYQVRAVNAFLEKPTAVEADKALAGGALWNTSVFAAKSEVLWQLGWQCFPDLMVRFEQLHAAIGTPEEMTILDHIYRDMPAYDIASDLLQHVHDRTAVIEMSGVLWSDWDTPERIAHTLRRIGRQPAFPLACLTRPFAPIFQGGSPNRVLANM